MGRCGRCGGEGKTMLRLPDGSYQLLCRECRKKVKAEQVEMNGDLIQKPYDFKQWDGGDLSELFWIHLGKYVKEPNEHSLHIIQMAISWAHHDSHALTNSFSHALAWAGIDMNIERERWRK